MVAINNSQWQKVIVDDYTATQLKVCPVCGGILEVGESVNIYYNELKVARFGVHRGHKLDRACCTSIFIGGYVSSYFYFLGVARGDIGIVNAYSQLSTIFGLGHRQLHRLYAKFQQEGTNGASSCKSPSP
mgnify:CR=1 FL=1